MKPEPDLLRRRFPIYASLNAVFLLAVLGMGLASGRSAEVPYLVGLALLCSSPMLLVDRLNGRYALFGIFFLLYFLYFGALDVVQLWPSAHREPMAPESLEAELVILVGGLLFALGYRAAVGGPGRVNSTFLAKDWTPASLLIVGGLCWILGAAANWYWNTRLIIVSGEFQNNLGIGLTSLVLAGVYVMPLGILLLAYAQATSRSRSLQALMIAIAIFQVFFGFIANTKGGAMLAGILVIVTLTLVTGRIPKAWVAAGLVFVVLVFPIFQAYRVIAVGQYGFTNAEAASNIGKAIELAISNRKLVANDFGGSDYHAQSFIERSSMKASVAMIVEGTGRSVPFQHGYTLIPLTTSLVPRVFWPNKLDVQTGRVLNQAFHVSESEDTYISPSHLGELYWNFGWPGVVIGMLLIGALAGTVARLCDLSAAVSVTRLILLAITIQQVCVRFEGSIAAEYAIWIRSTLAVLVWHGLMARRPRQPAAAASATDRRPSAKPSAAPAFPNLMR